MSSFQPKFRVAGTPIQASNRITKQADPVSGQQIPIGINTVPTQIRGAATDLWATLLSRPYHFDAQQAKETQVLLPYIEMNFRVYAAMAYLTPVVEPMLIWYSIDLDRGYASYETLALRGDIDPVEDPDLVEHLEGKRVTALQWLKVQTPPAQGAVTSFIVRSDLVLPAFAGELQLGVERVPIDNDRAQLRVGNTCSVGLREFPSNALVGLYALADFRPLINHSEMLKSDEQMGQEAAQQAAKPITPEQAQQHVPRLVKDAPTDTVPRPAPPSEVAQKANLPNPSPAMWEMLGTPSKLAKAANQATTPADQPETSQAPQSETEEPVGPPKPASPLMADLKPKAAASPQAVAGEAVDLDDDEEDEPDDTQEEEEGDEEEYDGDGEDDEDDEEAEEGEEEEDEAPASPPAPAAVTKPRSAPPVNLLDPNRQT